MQEKFINRIDLQRDVIHKVNQSGRFLTELAGLSKEAVSNWSKCNTEKNSQEIIVILEKLTECFYSLSNRSQEAIDEEYQELEQESKQYLSQLNKKLMKMA